MKKRTGAMLLVVVLAFALAAPAAAEAPAKLWTSSTWTTLIGWVAGWAGELGQVFGTSSVPGQTEAFPEMDPDGSSANAFPEMDPDGSSTNAFPEMDPDG